MEHSNEKDDNSSQTNENPTKNNEKLTDDCEIADLASAEEYLDTHCAQLLPYQKQMFLDVVYMDGLVVCAKGINYDPVLLNLLKAHCDPANLILVINSSDYEEKYYKQELNTKYLHESSTNANEREQNYLLGGIQFVTTRILVVDLLKNRIPLALITGIVVLRAHQIIESCQEAFALRLYRQGNKTGFIKAFSNSVESFTYGYGHVEKVMRNLFLKELFIWPRFHAIIQKSLKPFEPQVIELHIPMTSNMTIIQTHILDIMNHLVKEIKRVNRYVDMQEITVENCVTKRFHKILQAQLDSVWHQLSSHTKLLIADLKVLRSLMITIIYNDSVSSYALIKKYRTTSYAMSNSGWTLLNAAEQMFNLSRLRVFNKDDEFEPEVYPKWKVLSEILRIEIPNAILASVAYKPHILEQPVKVLILCHDSRTCYQLNQYLIQGGERFLFHTAFKNEISILKIAEKYRSISESNVNAVRIKNPAEFLKDQPPVKEYLSGKSQSKLSNTSGSSQHNTTNSSSNSTKKKGSFLRDRIAKQKEAAEDAEFGKEDNAKDKIENDELSMNVDKDEFTDSCLFKESYLLTVATDPTADESLTGVSQLTENVTFESFAEMENLNLTQIANSTSKPFVCIQTFKSYEDSHKSLDRTLAELDPGFIILYHSNVTAIRQIEVYEAQRNRHPRERMKVFLLVYSQTVEEQSYLTTLRREKEAFELLINTKKSMVVPEYQDGKTDDTFLRFDNNLTDDAIMVDTRKAGGQQIAVQKLPKIIVDMREFRSDLPCLIHRRGIEVVPVTITIGDYILTPEVCVERKSISDLIGSLNSGRLYNQCVQMTRYYVRPILLIEFDQNKPFYLQGHYIISGESMSNIDITQKLQLLTMYFPKLRLVWSPSPYATAQLFEELKQGRDEPDAKYASQIGSIESNSVDSDTFIDRINPNVYDFLMKLPGVNPRNINMIIRKVKNLKQLLTFKENELAELLDNKANGKMLWEIFHLTHKPVQDTNSDKQFGSKFRRGRNKMF